MTKMIMKPEPLKDKECVFEQDYIETEIKWNLALGHKIFKKLDVMLAVEWLKKQTETEANFNKVPTSIKLTKIIHLINKAFPDLQESPRKRA